MIPPVMMCEKVPYKLQGRLALEYYANAIIIIIIIIIT
jgi:hypothetical protein